MLECWNAGMCRIHQLLNLFSMRARAHSRMLHDPHTNDGHGVVTVVGAGAVVGGGVGAGVGAGARFTQPVSVSTKRTRDSLAGPG
mgnify:CR=1 FL=1